MTGRADTATPRSPDPDRDRRALPGGCFTALRPIKGLRAVFFVSPRLLRGTRRCPSAAAERFRSRRWRRPCSRRPSAGARPSRGRPGRRLSCRPGRAQGSPACPLRRDVDRECVRAECQRRGGGGACMRGGEHAGARTRSARRDGDAARVVPGLGDRRRQRCAVDDLRPARTHERGIENDGPVGAHAGDVAGVARAGRAA
jgi:hypothetical protein